MTSAAERACELVGNMLAAGPRDAAEVLAAAEGANISSRTIQRAAIALGVQKVKGGFSRGWTWRLPANSAEEGEDFTVNKFVDRRAEVIDIGLLKTEHPPSRAEVIAARLRKLEAGRGKVAPIYGQDPRVIRWADSGISDPDLREAYERAAADIEGDGPVTAGFLDRFIDQIISETAVS